MTTKFIGALSLCTLLLAPLILGAETSSPVYQDGILTRVRTTVVSNSCSASTQSDAASYGNTARRTADASARCSDIRGAIYTVAINGIEFELVPDHSRIAKASANLPLSAAFLKQSSMANHLPGTAVRLRQDDDGFLVLVDNRESHYRVFGVR